MHRIFAIVFIVLTIGVLAFYTFVSFGRAEVSFEIIESSLPQFHAEYYQGPYRSQNVESIFFKARDLAVEMGCTLAVLNLGSDQESREINQWIGLLLTDTTKDSTIQGYRKVDLPVTHWVVTRLQTHNFFMPSAAEVRKQALEFAEKSGFKLDNKTLEIYRSEKELEVRFPILD